MTETASNHPLFAIGWRGGMPAGNVVRVVARHRASYKVHDGAHTFDCQPAGKFLKRRMDARQRPAVGDFVTLTQGKDREIDTVLPRRSVLNRGAAGEHYATQVIATNIDYALILTGLDRDFNIHRIERYLLLCEGSGIQPVVLLGKIDIGENVTARVQQVRERLPASVPVHAVNSADPVVFEKLKAYFKKGDTAVLVGSSGAGKSTLTNTLTGHAVMATGETRQRDGRGRHTTIHRALLQLPTGGCLIDTPGMRELKFTGEETLVHFDDIEQLGQQCKFNNCTHGNEPGCAIREAVERGEMDVARLAHYQKLLVEHHTQAAQKEARRRRQGEGARPKARKHFR